MCLRRRPLPTTVFRYCVTSGPSAAGRLGPGRVAFKPDHSADFLRRVVPSPSRRRDRGGFSPSADRAWRCGARFRLRLAVVAVLQRASVSAEPPRDRRILALRRRKRTAYDHRQRRRGVDRISQAPSARGIAGHRLIDRRRWGGDPRRSRGRAGAVAVARRRAPRAGDDDPRLPRRDRHRRHARLQRRRRLEVQTLRHGCGGRDLPDAADGLDRRRERGGRQLQLVAAVRQRLAFDFAGVNAFTMLHRGSVLVIGLLILTSFRLHCVDGARSMAWR